MCRINKINFIPNKFTTDYIRHLSIHSCTLFSRWPAVRYNYIHPRQQDVVIYPRLLAGVLGAQQCVAFIPPGKQPDSVIVYNIIIA